jgi:hypothetical protein
MKISPFEKASVSNIKDLVLTLISIEYFKDVTLNPISEAGIVFCLSASLIFSITLMDGEHAESKRLEKEGTWELTEDGYEERGLIEG